MEDVSIASMIKILSETIGRRANKDFREFNLTIQQMKTKWRTIRIVKSFRRR